MQETNTLARPYAAAVFRLADESDQLDQWSEMLGFLAAVAEDERVKDLIADARVDDSKLAELLIDIGGGRLNPHARNLLKVLAENKRLAVIPLIQQQFDALRADAQKRETVEVIAAYEVDAKLQQRISRAMARRLGREVDLRTRVDRALIGGVIIRAGDLVLDASLRGRIKQLTSSVV